jgi:pyruvate/2-oxoacid:ferredoxin oxidoreductase alpha subunit
MKYSPLIAPIAVLMVIAYTQTFAGSAQDTARQSAIDAEADAMSSRIAKLADACHSNWQKLDWTMGQDHIPAANNPAFDAGIQRICRARAELFFEGYEIAPLIEPDSQAEIYPIVFGRSVNEIKERIRAYLPKLRLI